MILVPTDGVVGTIAKLYDQSPEAARVLTQFALYDAFIEQLDALRPEYEELVYKNIAEINAVSRRALLRRGVSKGLQGEEDEEAAEFAADLAIVDEHVEKGLFGWLLSQFNEQHPRDDRGRFAPKTTGGVGPHMEYASPGRQGAVDLAGVTLGASEGQGYRLTRGIFDREGSVRSGDQTAQDLYGPTQGFNRQAYNRLRVTGNALVAASTPGSTAGMVGRMAQFAGELGPEAEKVLGPGIRRAAYRYRGTEKKPDRAIEAEVTFAHVYATSPEALADELGQRNPSPAAVIAAANSSSRTTPDKKLLNSRGDAAVAAMLGINGEPEDNLLPNLDLVRLSLEAGEMPPSQGVIITADGKVATQAMGYNGDHYLPFDLRNLGALQGGQYVRTRATGGPTTEDIYTGLMTGTRQMQVVSNSGVFTIEFDPDLRGMRRYGDKARRMIERYGSLLERIADSERPMYEPGADLPAETLSQLRRKAMQMTGGDASFRTVFEDLKTRERSKLENEGVDIEELTEEGRREAEFAVQQEFETARRGRQPLPSKQQMARRVEELTQQYVEENKPTVRRMRLDGVGYGQALKALKQEFPYYIREARYEPLREWMDRRNLKPGPNQGPLTTTGSRDLGYVEPGQTNTSGTRSGGFRSARNVPTARTRAEAPAVEQQGGAAPQQQATQGKQPAQGGQKAAEPAQQANEAARSLQDPQGPVYRPMVMAANQIITAMSLVAPQISIDQSEQEANALTYSPLQYLHWKANRMAGEQGSKAPQAFVQWLASEAGEHERSKVMAALRAMPRYVQDASDPELGDDPAGTMDEAVTALETGLELLEPFAKVPEGQDPVTVEPEVTDKAKPPRLELVPDITADDEEFDRAQANISAAIEGDGQFDKDLAALSKLSTKQRADVVHQAWANFHDAERSADKLDPGTFHQIQRKLWSQATAWSFLHSRELAERLRELIGGGAGPKDPAVQEELVKRHHPHVRLLHDHLSELARILDS